jgi:polysaccharide biosynthesis protein PslH
LIRESSDYRNDPRASHGPAATAARCRILYLTHRVPYPPNRGDRIRSYHTLRFLAVRADVDLACLADEPVADDCKAVLAGLCRRVAIVPVPCRRRWLSACQSLARGRSATEGLFHSAELGDTLRTWGADTQYDAAVAFCSSMAQYLDVPGLKSSRRLVDLVDVDSQKWFDYADRALPPARWLFRFEGRRVRNLEQQLAHTADALTVVSSAEADLLRGFSPRAPVHAIPNGVDLDYFQPGPADAVTAEPTCVFVGALDYRANVDGISWFCEAVWPQVLAKIPTAKLLIVGRRPVASIKQLSARRGIEVIGDVPDVRPYLRRAQLVVVPLRIARGIQNKVLEALAMQKPVIASPQALEGLNLIPGQHACVADSAAQWVNIVVDLLNNPTQQAEYGVAGRAFVMNHHHWDACLRPMGQLWSLAEPPAAEGSSSENISAMKDPSRRANGNGLPSLCEVMGGHAVT